MAQATNYNPSQNVKLSVKKETTVGSHIGAALNPLQITAFTIPELSVPVEYSAQRSGSFVTLSDQAHHRQDTKMWTFDTTLRGTPTSILLATGAVFESASSAATLAASYSFPTAGYKDTSTTTPGTYCFTFDNAGNDGTLDHLRLVGCVGTGFTLTEDVGSEGGELVVTINWATAYPPAYNATDTTGGTTDVGSPRNIRQLDSANTYINEGSNEEIVVQSWELAVSRSIERIHYKTTTTQTGFLPFGYAMTGGFECTGSLTVIRNQDVYDLGVTTKRFLDSNTVNIYLQNSTSSQLIVDIPKAVLGESTIDNGGAVLTQALPFTVVGNVNQTSNLLSITTA